MSRTVRLLDSSWMRLGNASDAISQRYNPAGLIRVYTTHSIAK